MLDVNTVFSSTLKDQSKILQTSTFLCYFGRENLMQPLVNEVLPKVKTEVIEVHISCHFGFLLSTVDSVIIRSLLSLAFMLAL